MLARLQAIRPQRRLFAVDLDPRKLAVARQAIGPGPIYLATDLRNLPGLRVQTALLIDVLHYWPLAEQQTILAAVAACLPRGGRLVFRDGCHGNPGHGLVQWGEALARRSGFTRAGSGLWFRTGTEWQELLGAAGFALVEQRPDLGRSSNSVLVYRKH
jgi:hypothetical protein